MLSSSDKYKTNRQGMVVPLNTTCNGCEFDNRCDVEIFKQARKNQILKARFSEIWITWNSDLRSSVIPHLIVLPTVAAIWIFSIVRFLRWALGQHQFVNKKTKKQRQRRQQCQAEPLLLRVFSEWLIPAPYEPYVQTPHLHRPPVRWLVADHFFSKKH